MAKILFVITEDWALISHRLHLVKAAIHEGHEVAVATRFNSKKEIIQSLEVKTYDWRLVRRSLNLLHETKLLFDLRHIINDFKPDLVHAVAHKPVIYCGILKFFFRKKFSLVAALGGLGYVFYSAKIKVLCIRYLICQFLKLTLSTQSTVLLLQNMDNVRTLEKLGVVEPNRSLLVKGSGVEIDVFKPSPMPLGKVKIILPARLLHDKGVAEFILAAKAIKEQEINSEFILVGDIDEHNPSFYPINLLRRAVSEGAIQHLGRQENMHEIYSDASIVCLPSYHEGLPKVLLEASACCRPIIAFDVEGCREIVKHNENGILVPFKNQEKLEEALITLIKNREKRVEMGLSGRRLVEENFSSDIVNSKIFSIWGQLLGE